VERGTGAAAVGRAGHPVRPPPLGTAEWRSLFDAEGRLVAGGALRHRAFEGGLEPAVRREAWPFLLGLHAPGGWGPGRRVGGGGVEGWVRVGWVGMGARIDVTRRLEARGGTRLASDTRPDTVPPCLAATCRPPARAGSTAAERSSAARARRREYRVLRRQWESISPPQAARFSKWRERRTRVDKDVRRTDRSLPFYAPVPPPPPPPFLPGSGSGSGSGEPAGALGSGGPAGTATHEGEPQPQPPRPRPWAGADEDVDEGGGGAGWPQVRRALATGGARVCVGSFQVRFKHLSSQEGHPYPPPGTCILKGGHPPPAARHVHFEGRPPATRRPARAF
jgi:hypothetical protein